jgi:hypothetical protein
VSHASRLIADAIKSRALEILQEADEIGGPDWREYAQMMDAIAAECAQRAKTARESHGPGRCLRMVQEWCLQRGTDGWTAEIWETGGGCQAIGAQPASASFHWLVTDADGASPPDDPAAPCIVGHYGADGRFVTFNAPTLADGLRLMASLASWG